eukprot:6099877-Prymnesium_polylepis.1
MTAALPGSSCRALSSEASGRNRYHSRGRSSCGVLAVADFPISAAAAFSRCTRASVDAKPGRVKPHAPSPSAISSDPRPKRHSPRTGLTPSTSTRVTRAAWHLERLGSRRTSLSSLLSITRWGLCAASSARRIGPSCAVVSSGVPKPMVESTTTKATSAKGSTRAAAPSSGERGQSITSGGPCASSASRIPDNATWKSGAW